MKRRRTVLAVGIAAILLRMIPNAYAIWFVEGLTKAMKAVLRLYIEIRIELKEEASRG